MSKSLEEIAKLVLTNVAHILDQCKDHPDVFKHYVMLLSVLGECYTERGNNAVLLANIDGNTAIMSVNATEMQITKLMSESQEYVMAKVMADAPEKTMFN